MSQVEFDYNQEKIIIQCRPDEKMKEVIQKFLTKFDNKLSNEIFFLFGGNKLDEELTFNEIAKNIDKESNQLNILVKEEKKEEKSSFLKKSKNIICPECKENARISLNEYKITIYGCKNGHKNNNIQLNEFEKTQTIDEARIMCDNCKTNKSEIYENKLYICFECKINLCPICKSKHDSSHSIIDYEQKDFICREHCDSYINYCIVCKKDLCTLCEKSHIGHKIISYGSIIPDIISTKNQLKNLKERISELKIDVKDIITKLNILLDNLENYIMIYNDLINNFNIRKRNYSILQNINDLMNYNNIFITNASEIINDKNFKTKFNGLIDMYDKMSFKDKEKEEANKIITEIMKEENDKNGYNSKKNCNDGCEKCNDGFTGNTNFNENFEISKLKIFKKFSTKYENEELMILNDGRILSYQKYCNENGDELYKLCVYNLTNDAFICDINYDTEEFISILPLSDNNILVSNYNKLKILKIKEKSFEEIQINTKKNFDKIYKLSNDRILLKYYDINNKNEKFEIYLYEKGKLVDSKITFEIKSEYIFNDLCEINKNEIVIFCFKEGKNRSYLIFYDIKNNKKIKELKLGDTYRGKALFLLNEDALVVKCEKKLILVDIKKRDIKKDLQLGFRIRSVISLNNKIFLIENFSSIFQLEIENLNKIIFKGKKTGLQFLLIKKYPENKLITSNGKEIIIYGY